ncbi:YcjF family protein [Colwellia sp. MB3u-55]|uniref:YcjF family protein n=1 Tax=Colwellia sp. MB3u-55 TaxID=2759810 RepID=UPI0015F65019|nr:TIGR01620 family protein [Colwellia sp. MB3u-55]MBA6252722.1 TIGR01620 family protein [Colwellia sp. MB3u-55]
MNELDEKYQQQILFENDELTIKKSHLPSNGQQVIVGNDDWQASEDLSLIKQGYLNDDNPKEKTKPRWLWRVLGTVFAGVVMVETFTFFQQGFAQSPILAGMYGVLLFGLSVIVGSTAIREYSALRQFKRQQSTQAKAKDILATDLASPRHIDVKALCESISANLPCDLMSEHEKSWHSLVKEEYSDEELLQLYSREVLSKVDEKALDEVAKFSTEAVVLVALSPIALVDMMLIFWRNLRMIDKVAALYGLKIGYWSRIKLIKQVFVNMAYAGASELVIDLGADLVGAELLGKLSARMAQGLGAGMLTSRLGIQTIKLCRPIPFEENTPKTAQVRKKILSQVKKLLIR